MKVRLAFPRFFVTIADVARHLRQTDVPVFRGPLQLSGSWPDQKPADNEPKPFSVRAGFRMRSDGFSLGLELTANVVPGLYGQTRLAECDLQNIRLEYTDDRLETEALRHSPVEDLIDLLRREENRVPGHYPCDIPGGECLQFSPPLKALMFRGEEARVALLSQLDDLAIQNEIVLALGAVGNEATVPELISRYPRAPLDPANLAPGIATVCFSYALCWLTGQAIDRSRQGTDWDGENAQKWDEWWRTNRETFRVPGEKPYATWVPKYPLLTDERVAQIRSSFAEQARGFEFE